MATRCLCFVAGGRIFSSEVRLFCSLWAIARKLLDCIDVLQRKARRTEKDKRLRWSYTSVMLLQQKYTLIWVDCDMSSTNGPLRVHTRQVCREIATYWSIVRPKCSAEACIVPSWNVLYHCKFLQWFHALYSYQQRGRWLICTEQRVFFDDFICLHRYSFQLYG